MHKRGVVFLDYHFCDAFFKIKSMPVKRPKFMEAFTKMVCSFSFPQLFQKGWKRALFHSLDSCLQEVSKQNLSPFFPKMEENPYMKGLQSMASAGRNTYYNDSFVDTSFDGVLCQVRPVAIKQEDYWLFQSSHVRHKVLTKPIFKNCCSYTHLVCNCTQCFLVHSDIMSHTNVVSYTQQEVANIHQKQNLIQAQCTWLSHMLE